MRSSPEGPGAAPTLVEGRDRPGELRVAAAVSKFCQRLPCVPLSPAQPRLAPVGFGPSQSVNAAVFPGWTASKQSISIPNQVHQSRGAVL